MYEKLIKRDGWLWNIPHLTIQYRNLTRCSLARNITELPAGHPTTLLNQLLPSSETHAETMGVCLMKNVPLPRGGVMWHTMAMKKTFLRYTNAELSVPEM